MKVAIISDLHIGQTLYRNTEDGLNKYELLGYEILEKYTDACLNADLVIVCGDIFHTPNPSIMAINAFNKMYDTLSEAGIKVASILGNHDFNMIQAKHGISSVSAVADCVDFYTHIFAYDDVRFYFVPWTFDKEQKEKYEKSIKLDKNSSNVLIAHGTTETYMNKFNSNIQFDISDEFIKQFNFAFIGHVHDYAKYNIGDTQVYSVGSMINYAANKLTTGILWFDTETLKITQQIINTPYTEKITTDDLNTIEIKENNIYKIMYTGDVEKIDNDTYTEIKKKALAVTLELPEEKQEESAEDFESDFMAWLRSNYADKVELFEKMKQ